MDMDNGTPIAIIGYAYRAPGVGRKGLWEFLAEAKSAWSKVPADRFDQDAFYHPDSEKPGGFSSQGAHFLPDDIYGFDAPFFNLRAEEARSVDPQHRIMLECALEAAESAGLSLVELAGANIGVFSAIGSSEYAQQLMDDLPSTTRWTATGVAGCMFANRLSYFFDLTGPSVALDTACASSTYAIHMACQSLRAGECNAAFVGAGSLIYGPDQWNVLNKMGYSHHLDQILEFQLITDKQSTVNRGQVFFLRRKSRRIWPRRGGRVPSHQASSGCNRRRRSDPSRHSKFCVQSLRPIRRHHYAKCGCARKAPFACAPRNWIESH